MLKKIPDIPHPDPYVSSWPDDIGKRLKGIHPRVNLAAGQSVSVCGKKYEARDGNRRFFEIPEPEWKYADGDKEACIARIEVNDKLVGFQWLVHEDDGCEHTVSAFDIKVDEQGGVYCLAHYASLEGRVRCINCDGMIICGINPMCPPT